MGHEKVEERKWEHHALENVAEIILGAHVKKSEQGKGRASRLDKFDMINVRDLEGRMYLDSRAELETLELARNQVPKRSLVKEGDVLLVYRGAVARSAIVTKELEGAVASSNLLILRPGDRLLSETLLSFFWSHMSVQALQGQQTGSINSVLSKSDLAELVIPVPPLAVQKKIAGLLEATSTTYQTSLQAAEMYKQVGMMAIADLLAGQKKATSI